MIYPKYSEFAPIIRIEEIKAAGDKNHEFIQAMNLAGYGDFNDIPVVEMPFSTIKGQCPEWLGAMRCFFLDGSVYATDEEEHEREGNRDCIAPRLLYRFTPVIPAHSLNDVLISLEQASTLYEIAYKDGFSSGKRFFHREIIKAANGI